MNCIPLPPSASSVETMAAGGPNGSLIYGQLPDAVLRSHLLLMGSPLKPGHLPDRRGSHLVDATLDRREHRGRDRGSRDFCN